MFFIQSNNKNINPVIAEPDVQAERPYIINLFLLYTLSDDESLTIHKYQNFKKYQKDGDENALTCIVCGDLLYFSNVYFC